MALEPWGNGAHGGRTQLPLSAHLTACPIVTPKISQEGVLS
jgi:hypothetical protein